MELRNPWLVAAWPGMGFVGHLAANALARGLSALPLAEVSAGEHFDLTKVQSHGGILLPAQQPRTILTGWRSPTGGRDLVVLISEQAPTHRLRTFCSEVLRVARGLGVVRAYTFAAMASASPLGSPARVFTAATDAQLLAELVAREAEPLAEGEIGGMNGVFLSVAAEQGIPGACLLGEFPFFASAVPNPKAAAAVLKVFARIAALELDVREIEEQGQEVERQLKEHLEKAEEAAQKLREGALEEGEAPADWPSPPEEPVAEPEPGPLQRLTRADKQHIEALFAAADRDRGRALALKNELDRLGVFGAYEDRFLDLFRRAE